MSEEAEKDIVMATGYAQPQGEYRDPADYGSWEGDVFVFNEPVDIGGGHQMQRLDTSQMVVEEGITREDVIHALLNPILPPGAAS